MTFMRTEEQEMVINSLKTFMEEEILPYEAEADLLGHAPEGVGQRIKEKSIEMGFYAANLPEEVGGGGLDYSTMALFERELGKTGYGLHGFIGRPTELLMACNEEQRERYLTPCITGEKHEFFALTEPGAGSDIMSMQTKAVKDGDDYILNGSKHFISSVVHCDFAIVFAQTGIDVTSRGERKRITAFLVDEGTPRYSVTRGPRCMSQRAYPTFQLSFDDVRLPASQILGEEGKGLELAGKWLGMGRIWVASACCGRMERLLEMATSWAAERKQFGKPIGSFQGTSFKLADMATDLRIGDLMIMDACARADQGMMTDPDAAMTKLFCSEAVGRAADNTIQIYGGLGLMEDLPIEHMWRDSRIDRIWDGTSEIQRHIISRSLLRPHGA